MSTLTAPSDTASQTAGPTGQRIELGRYTLPDGEPRVLYGQRVDGHVRVTDNPARSGGRAYLVEREVEQDGHSALLAIVTDYLHQADRLGAIPMAVPPVSAACRSCLEHY